MDLSRWPGADALIDEALELPAPERAAFIERASGGDRALRAALLAVVGEAERPDAFLEPAGALSGPLFADLAAMLDPGLIPHALAPGASLGTYRVADLIGRGGMGEVYRARDTKLGREVALKILPARFAADPERLARFEREARVLASLTHPHIGAIHDVVECDGVRALVLELVEGPTLAERLAAGPMTVPQVIQVARGIASALEAAHARAIVHRDLKPSNIKLTLGGVKVLDFGLAKALRSGDADGGGAGDPLSTADVRPRAVMGTAAYMSPEQVRGERIDHRADIWAFGCVLYEMLTGARAFGGQSSTETLACVLERAPDLMRLPAGTPPRLRTLVERCLAKDPRRRLGWIGDALLELEDLEQGPPASRGELLRRSTWLVASAAAAGGALLAWGAGAYWRPASPAAPLARLAIALPPGDQLVAGDHPAIAISRDGRTIVYRARRAGAVQLFRRDLSAAEPQPIPGTEHAMAPFLSPDGRWVGFTRDGTLVKVPLEGGPAVSVCEVSTGAAAAWLDDDTIVFGGEGSGGLQRVRAGGGAPEALTKAPGRRAEESHGLPQAVPGGRAVLFTQWEGGRPQVALADVPGGSVRRLAPGQQPRLVGSTLVFVRERALWAAPIDLGKRQLTGEPVPLREPVDVSASTGAAHFAVAEPGTLVYLPRRSDQSRARSLVWVDRAGREEPVGIEAAPFTRASIAPDGARIALAITSTEGRAIWIHARDRGTLTRLTPGATSDTAPIWTPDGQRVIFRSERDGGGLFAMRADGAGPVVRVSHAEGAIQTPYDVTRDGRLLLFTAFRTYRDQGIGVIPLDRSGDARTVVDGQAAELRPHLSPDGRWLAYQSDESGRFEVYVRPWPAVEEGRWQISARGGTSPRWGPGGRELFFFSDGAIHRVAVETQPAFRAGVPERLFAADLQEDRLGPLYDVSPDGQRFLFIRGGGPQDALARSHLAVVQNWEPSRR